MFSSIPGLSSQNTVLSLPYDSQKYLCTWMRARSLQLCLFATLWGVAHEAPLSMGFSRQEYWSEFPCLPPGNLPNPGIEPVSLATPALHTDSLLLSHQGSPKISPDMTRYLLVGKTTPSWDPLLTFCRLSLVLFYLLKMEESILYFTSASYPKGFKARNIFF